MQKLQNRTSAIASFFLASGLVCACSCDNQAPRQPTHKIIHICDWHLVDKADFAADLRDQSHAVISDQEIDRLYNKQLKEVEEVQREQMELLRVMATLHGIKRVYVEGLADGDELIYANMIEVLRNHTGPIEGQHRIDLLRVGAVGKLILAGDIQKALPLEDLKAYNAANPVAADGSVRFDAKLIEAREDSQCRRLLSGLPVAIVVLGGSHDLRDNLERLSGGTAEYLRVEPDAWKAAVQ